MDHIDMSCIAEQTEVSSSTEKQLFGLVHIEAPALISDERESRAPISISAVIDRSGSMNGAKLNLVLWTF